MKPLIAILSLSCLGLAAGLLYLYTSTKSPAHRQALETRVLTYSNQIEEVRAKLSEQENLATYLQSNLTLRATELAAISNQLNTTAGALSQSETQFRAAQTEAQKLSARITQIEGERDGLQAKLNDLAAKITTLNSQIAETQRKLAAAEGDRDSLTKELARLQTDKAELVRQFNDVAVVRAQLALLKEEIAVNQRLAWTSQGVYQRAGMKGAQALVARPTPFLAESKPAMEIELYRDNPKTAPAELVPAELAPAQPTTPDAPAVPSVPAPK